MKCVGYATDCMCRKCVVQDVRNGLTAEERLKPDPRITPAMETRLRRALGPRRDGRTLSVRNIIAAWATRENKGTK